jgi:predicted MFS family arabinose efflux permease
VQVLGVGTAVLVLSAIAYVRVPLLPSIGHELSLSAADLGLLTTVFALGRLIADIPVGRLSDLRPVASMLAGAAACLGVASLGMAAAVDNWQLLTAFFFLGVSSSVVNTTGMVYFAEVASHERRGRSMAAFSAALLGGQALGPALGGSLATFWGWRTAMAIGGAVGLLAGVATMLRPRRRSTTTKQPEATSIPAEVRPAPRVPMREQAILYFVPFAMFFTFGALPQTLLPIIGADEFELSVGVIGLVLGAGGVCRFIGAMVGGAVSDRVSRKAALVPGLVLQAAGIALLAWEGSLWAWVAAIVIMSLASFSVSVAATMLVDRSGGRRAGRRLGPFRFAGDVGLITGPFTASLVYESLGQRPTALMVAGLLTVSALGSAFGLRETRRLSQDADLDTRLEQITHS